MRSVTQSFLERDSRVLPELMRQARKIATYPTSAKKLYQIAADLPTDKFYIGDDAAFQYMRKRLFHNVRQKFLSPYKQRLFDALHEEVTAMLKQEKYQNMSLKSVIIIALNHPAPCVGLTPNIIARTFIRHHKHKKNKKHE